MFIVQNTLKKLSYVCFYDTIRQIFTAEFQHYIFFVLSGLLQ